MSMTTRDAVDAMLPPGTSVEDLNEQELGKLFEAVVARTRDDETGAPLSENPEGMAAE